jgi:Large eukaryotic DNA virus major capsid protein/Major capsid protein N-terminus
MSGPVFNLISNTSKADNLLYAQEYLTSRINDIIKQRSGHGVYTDAELLALPKKDKYLKIDDYILPNLNDIDKSHSTFVNSVYKPSIPVATEYIKIQGTSPQFGSTITFQLPQIGNFIADCMLHVRISAINTYDTRDRIRYVAMPGHKLIKNVKVLVNNGIIIDEFGTDDYNSYFHFEVFQPHKFGYMKNVGQEIPHVGYLTPDHTVDMFREYKFIGDGNQTLKQRHEAVDMMIPTLFWFNKIKNAIPSLSWGTIQIQVEFANSTDIIGFYDGGGGGNYTEPKIEFCDLYTNNIFTTPDIFSLYAKKFVFSIIRVHKAHKEVIRYDKGQHYSTLLSNLKFPTELLYLSLRPRENLALSQYWYKSSKLTEVLYRMPVVARDQTTVITGYGGPGATTNTVTLTNTSSALSTSTDVYVGYNLIIISGYGCNTIDIEKNRFIVTAYDGITGTFSINGVWDGFLPNANTQFELYIPQLAINSATYYKEEPIASSISLISSGVEIFKSNNEMFYNSYLPLKFNNINTPSDIGVYMVPFCLNPLDHSPSGSLNFSVCKETYLEFISSNINDTYPVDLLVLSRAINFIIVDQESGGMMLKYMT